MVYRYIFWGVIICIRVGFHRVLIASLFSTNLVINLNGIFASLLNLRSLRHFLQFLHECQMSLSQGSQLRAKASGDNDLSIENFLIVVAALVGPWDGVVSLVFKFGNSSLLI